MQFLRPLAEDLGRWGILAVNVLSLFEDLDSSPSPRHLTNLWARRLDADGFERLAEGRTVSLSQGYFCREGVLIAWRNMDQMGQLGVRLLGAHTDSPGLHLKPSIDRSGDKHGQLSVEVYGSPILSSWFDRDLGLAGTAHLDDGSDVLFHVDRPLARIAHLAIHLDREINDRGHVIDRHRHLAPIWSVGPNSLKDSIAEQVAVDPSRIVTISGQLVDTQRASLLGRANEFVSSSRLDNQVSCWAAMHALVGASTTRPIMAVLYDHEEIGSASTDGAAGPLLERLLERLALVAGLSRGEYLSMLESCSMLSMDNSHAIHPNHPERHDTDNAPILGGGVAIKTNSNQRYATTGRSSADVAMIARVHGIAIQHFSSRNDVPCGSTIGPITATRLGIQTTDVGVPQLAMHSIREMCHVDDVVALALLAAAYLRR